MSLVGPSFGLGDWTGQCTCSPNESPFSIAVLWSCLSFSVAGWHGWGRCSCIAPTRPCQSCQLRNYKTLHGTSRYFALFVQKMLYLFHLAEIATFEDRNGMHPVHRDRNATCIVRSWFSILTSPNSMIPVAHRSTLSVMTKCADQSSIHINVAAPTRLCSLKPKNRQDNACVTTKQTLNSVGSRASHSRNKLFLRLELPVEVPALVGKTQQLTTIPNIYINRKLH